MINVTVILPDNADGVDVRVPVGETVQQFADMLAETYQVKIGEHVAMTSAMSGETYTTYDRITTETFVSGDTVILRG
ncbi:hypothetical protein K1728_04220 [Weissella confusa]|uniref:hypothetical protein n=1 Tax=Weissella confusa TaxID=1583 RepID=UPI001C6FA197|nr:hypothetical protein [Weissella confusa]QYU58612.1 hypothetical protein K1728_04220 [Weissella confusa]